MNFIDTHTHLYEKEFSEDSQNVVQRAINSGISILLLPGIDSSHILDILGLCNQFPDNCFPMAGLHPTSVKENYRDELACVEMELSTGKYVAVGEIGIDLYWDKTYFKQQADALTYQLQLAQNAQLPVVIHTRNSFDETYALLSNFPSLKGIFHCFSGDIRQAYQAIERGFKIGVGGVVTYKNSLLAEVVREMPPESIVLETDAPYLSPVPFRGKRNESAYLLQIAQKVADIKGISIETVAEITTKNALFIFDKLKK